MTTSRAAVFAGLATLLLCSVSPLSANAAAQREQAFAPDRNDPVARRCDLLVNSPDDPQRVGNGVELGKIDVGQALPACQQAAQRRPARPRYQFLYGRALDKAKRYAEAVQQYAAADQAGYPRATLMLGTMYQDGLGVPRDPGRAASLYQRAADAGFADGYAALGLLSVQAMPPDYGQAFSLFDRAASFGSITGRALLGELYINGLGVPQNQTRAISLFQQAANGGDPEGMLDLGVSYFAGVGVPRDSRTAFRWLSRAADFGFAQAQDIVGYMYEEGDGVAQSNANAMAWYRKAAAQDDPFAMTHLGELLSDAGKGTEAVDLFRKAAAKGYVDAEVQLAIDYRNGGDGIARDDRLAAYWYGKSAAQGDGFSQSQLAVMYERGEGVERNPAEARRLYQQMQASSNPAPAPHDNTPDVQGGIISPPPGYSREPSYDNQPQKPVIGRQDNTPDPPHRPLPTQPSVSSGDNVGAVVILGVIAIGAAWLFSGSGSSQTGNTPTQPYDPFRSYPQPKGPFDGADPFGNPCYPKYSLGCN
jgi:TPR repeat protein